MIRVTDTQKNKEYICSKSEAGRIIGVTYKTILRWSKKKQSESFNQFIVTFTPITVLKKGGKKHSITLKDVLFTRENKTKNKHTLIAY